MIRQIAAAISLSLFAVPALPAQSVRIGVLGIFHPQQLILSANAETVVVKSDNEQIFLEPRTPSDAISIRASKESLIMDFRDHRIAVKSIHATARSNGAATFLLSVPGKLQRRYHGVLDLSAASGTVIPVVTMDLETAVSSVVQAESQPGTPLEALKAQAVVTRSYLVAGTPRHSNFDFCDLTHCQFLREPANSGTPAHIATAATQGLVIAFAGEPVAAMFTRSCGGHTRTPAEIGMPMRGYPYYPVVCDYCYKHPVRWSRRVSPEDARQLSTAGEVGRLSLDRRLGWDAVPSNNFAAYGDGREVLLEGAGQGHGVGLCQRGASAMADHRANFREILRHYFPNTSIFILQSN